MIQVENKHWEEVDHSPFVMPFAGHLVVHSFTGEELSEQQLAAAASYLTESADTRIQKATLDTDPDLPRMYLSLNFEAEGDLDALRHMCTSAIKAWSITGHEIDDLEFVAAHLVYEPQFKADHDEDPTLEISSARYSIERLELPELDDFDEPVITEPQDVFYKVRDEALAGH